MTQPKELSLQDFPHSEKQAPGMRLLQADFTNTTVLTLPDIDYVCREGHPLHLHIMIPQKQSPDSDTVDGPYPLIVYVQGSAWFKQNTAMNLAQLGRMARRGFVIASVEYRPSDLAPFPAQIEDTKTAIRYLRQQAGQYKINPRQVVLWGDSSGGHTVVMSGITAGTDWFDTGVYAEESCAVAGIVDYYGPSLVSEMASEPSNVDHVTAQSPEGMLLGQVKVHDHLDLAQAASPIPYIDQTRRLPPIVIFHGSKDRTVPFGQSVLLYNQLRDCGQAVEFYRIEGADHGGPAFWTDEVLDLTESHIRQFIQAIE